MSDVSKTNELIHEIRKTANEHHDKGNWFTRDVLNRAADALEARQVDEAELSKKLHDWVFHYSHGQITWEALMYWVIEFLGEQHEPEAVAPRPGASDVSKTNELIADTKSAMADRESNDRTGWFWVGRLLDALEAATREPVQGEPNDEDEDDIPRLSCGCPSYTQKARYGSFENLLEALPDCPKHYRWAEPNDDEGEDDE